MKGDRHHAEAEALVTPPPGSLATSLAVVSLSEPATVSAEHVESLRRLGWTDGDILDAVSHGANLVGSSLLHRAFVR